MTPRLPPDQDAMDDPASAFLFPHQDDEFGVFALLERNRRAGTRSICVFLTDGAGNGADPARRDRESLAVLASLGVPPEDVLFLPEGERAPDGRLVERMEPVLASLERLLEGVAIGDLHAPSWEGGHPDHDAAALIATALAPRIGARAVWHFALYSAYAVTIMPFCVLRPVPRGTEERLFPVGPAAALRYLSLCLRYPSQWKTWLGLLPFVGLHFLREGSQQVHALPAGFHRARPHEGALLYERRGWTDWETFSGRAAGFVAAHLERT